jgi:hypothetical protein
VDLVGAKSSTRKNGAHLHVNPSSAARCLDVALIKFGCNSIEASGSRTLDFSNYRKRIRCKLPGIGLYGSCTSLSRFGESWISEPRATGLGGPQRSQMQRASSKEDCLARVQTRQCGMSFAIK